MRLNQDEKKLLAFLRTYPNQWHSFKTDKKTTRTLGSLYLYRGLGLRGLEIDRNTMQMYYNTTVG